MHYAGYRYDCIGDYHHSVIVIQANLKLRDGACHAAIYVLANS